MKKPKMILFDYGQTLAAEEKFDGVKGTAAVMQYASENRYGLTPEQVQQEADAINRELGRSDPVLRAQNVVEIPNHMFTAYLYESLGIRIDLAPEDLDRIFWDAAAPARPTKGMPEFLRYLRMQGIRTAVLSNISFAPSVVEERIGRLFPDHPFKFIIATSAYLFRKPSPRIFRLALEKAQLAPEDVWYIGDTYSRDVAGAKNAGIFPVWYRACEYFEQPDHDDVVQITDWEQLKALLASCEPEPELKICFHEEAEDKLLKFAVIIAKSGEKWVFCKHKERDTCEVPGGHREPGERIDETAARELREETGALDFAIQPVCVYSVTGKNRVNDTGEETFGKLYFAQIESFERELHSEMEKVLLLDALPENWTYPLLQPKMIEEAKRRGIL